MTTPLQSYRRLRREPSFAANFYERLLASDRRIAKMFAKTDFKKQHDLFLHGLQMLLEYAEGRAIGEMAIARLSERHGPQDLNVPPELYDPWVESLMATAKELDPAWTQGLERRFRTSLSKGIAEMTRAYREQSPS